MNSFARILTGSSVTLLAILVSTPPVYRLISEAITKSEEWTSTGPWVRRGSLTTILLFYLVAWIVLSLFIVQWTMNIPGKTVCTAIALSLWFVYFVAAKSALYITFVYRIYVVFEQSVYSMTMKTFRMIAATIFLTHAGFITAVVLFLVDSIEPDCSMQMNEFTQMIVMALNLTYCLVDFVMASWIAVIFVKKMRAMAIEFQKTNSVNEGANQNNLIHSMYKLSWLSIMGMISSWGFGIIIVNESWWGAAIDVVVTIYVVISTVRSGLDYYDRFCICCVKWFQDVLKKRFDLSLENDTHVVVFESTTKHGKGKTKTLMEKIPSISPQTGATATRSDERSASPPSLAPGEYTMTGGPSTMTPSPSNSPRQVNTPSPPPMPVVNEDTDMQIDSPSDPEDVGVNGK